MQEWHRIMKKVQTYGTPRNERTGVGTLALFGEQLVFDNSLTFPAVTTKHLAFGQVCAELACFLRGYDSLEQFHSMGCSIWDGNGAAEYWQERRRFEGDLGRIYGVQWRDWKSPEPLKFATSDGCRHTDQLRNLVEGMRKEPHGRRHIVTALNPGELDQMCLPPCHVLFQAYISGSRVDMRVDMRSVDLFLGLPFDIASYAVLQRLLARELGLQSGWLIFQLGDAHIYNNHKEQVAEALSRAPRLAPELMLDPRAGLFTFVPEYAQLRDYAPHPKIAAPLNV